MIVIVGEVGAVDWPVVHRRAGDQAIAVMSCGGWLYSVSRNDTEE